MSQVKNHTKKYWRSLADKASELDASVVNEFPEGITESPSEVNRRDFFKLMGASFGLAGLTSCGFRKPEQEIMPYVKMPEEIIPGRALFYATSYYLGYDVTGLLVESHEGRPTKVEGNPAHPQSLGATNQWHQASVLSLYDPDRLKSSKKDGKSLVKEAISDELKISGDGSGTAILTETLPSPTYKRVLGQLKSKFSGLSVFTYDSVNSDNASLGIKSVSGQAMLPVHRANDADIILGFGTGISLLGAGTSVVNSKEVSSRRAPESDKKMSRIYAIESGFSPLGGLADHRIQVKHVEVKYVLAALISELIKKGISIKLPSEIKGSFNAFAGRASAMVDTKLIKAMVSDCLAAKSKSIVCAGQNQPSSVHALVYVLNEALGNNGKTVLYKNVEESSSLKEIRDFSARLDAGEVKKIFILGSNPVLTAPADLNLSEKLKKAEVVHLTQIENETSQSANLILAESHYLEAWGDLESLDGTISPVQPLISPLYDSMDRIEMLTAMMGDNTKTYDSVKSTHKLSDKKWKKWLHNGVGLKGIEAKKGASPKLSGLPNNFIAEWGTRPITDDEREVFFSADMSVYDGRFSNNGWLQETPDPISKVTWDNALFMSPHTAKSEGIESGDMVEATVSGMKLNIVADILPGLAKNSFLIHLGYGSSAGRIGAGVGYHGESIRTSDHFDFAIGLGLKKLKKKAEIANVQNHNHLAPDPVAGVIEVEDRPLYLETTQKILGKGFDTLKKQHGFKKLMTEKDEDGHSVAFGSGSVKSLWEERTWNEDMAEYQWGMTIDLSKCTACGTCSVACQAENNIPIVGKKEVIRGREMHWIRVDRYFEGDEEEPHMGLQPVTCLQCENAPCEQVCPVGATVHSEEGLNDMVYNRCIGTRYCSNNCPYKVRRFNYFDYHQKNPQSVKKEKNHYFDYSKEPAKTHQMGFNPDVSVRMRGVMEKCTFCVQRINEAKIIAKNEDRKVQDGEISPACVQACPTDAIIFGSLLDKNSKVVAEKKKTRNYEILAELNTKPRTSYLAAIKNPHPTLEKEVKVEDHHHSGGH